MVPRYITDGFVDVYCRGVSTNAVLEIKCGSSIIRDVWIMGAFAKSYEAGAHWYTNDLNLWQPEFNRIEGMQFWWLVIGLAIGVLPSQPTCCSWQGAVVPDTQATNAPLSESSMTGLEFCECPVCPVLHHSRSSTRDPGLVTQDGALCFQPRI